MKVKLLVGLLVGMSSALVSCSDQMDHHKWTNYDYNYITAEFSNVDRFVTRIYAHLDNGYNVYGSAMDAAACDEAEYAKRGGATESFFDGTWSPSKSLSSLWSDGYEAISDANVYLMDFSDAHLKFPELEMDESYDKLMYKYEKSESEVRLLRAYFYFQLARQYGDVPLVLKKLETSEVNSLTRTPVQKVFKFIEDECTALADSLPYDWATTTNMPSQDPGRVNNLFALALKGRTALYAASPLFNKENKKDLWKTAAEANWNLIKVAEANGAALGKYTDLWSETNYSDCKEVLFARRLGASYAYESTNFPQGTEKGGGGNCPSQTLAEAYEVLENNGKSSRAFNWAEDRDDPCNPDKRDPRFGMTFVVNDETGWPNSNKTPLEMFEGGKNGEPLVGATPTGYYLKKLLNGSVDFTATKPKTKLHNWVTFRLGEFYLNYAEAVFKYLGSADATSAEFPMSAREAVNKIRARKDVNMPALPAGLSNDEFWKRYENERMVELAFEGHRFYDLRRWKEGDKLKTIVELKIKKVGDSFQYERKVINRQWDDKMYLFPIPLSETIKNKNLGQNPGW